MMDAATGCPEFPFVYNYFIHNQFFSTVGTK
jgi:hypothetical protein